MDSSDLRSELKCTICLEVYKDPTTLGCGHNFCQICIKRMLDRQESQGYYSCPQCRSTFRTRPTLQKNVTLANIAESFQAKLSSSNSGLQKARVLCTYCLHATVNAVKSCLHCEVSLCEDHLKLHSKWTEHTLIEPCASLGTRKCPVHKKLLEYYCTVDAACICASCKHSSHHRGHQVQTLHEASRGKKDRLKNTHTQLIANRQEMERDINQLLETEEKINNTVANLSARTTSLYQGIKDQITAYQLRTSRDIDEIWGQSLQNVAYRIEQLEGRKVELSGEISHLEELFHTTDPLTVLQEEQSDRKDFLETRMEGLRSGINVKMPDEAMFFLKLRKFFSDVLHDLPSLFEFPRMADVGLDTATASANVSVSCDVTTAHGIQAEPSASGTGDQFESHQVLSGVGLCGGRQYWEVELSGTSNWRVGMTYRSIDRRGPGSVFGNTEKSWCLCQCNRKYFFRHNGGNTDLNLEPNLTILKLGIYLDFDAGQLSFYSLEPELKSLHTFQACFTEPLYAALRVGNGVCMKIIQ
ncbi:E3 ubiquitin/ISG15 ligase TRIM25-like [Hyperolius riggenbachi]|uniref:E3 ubiquitin/ISG15 ligase TRIM25-like n=1 Tax=Hyperolius riggenbachi TaxID=752182 RepID=UPI0035A2FD7E